MENKSNIEVNTMSADGISADAVMVKFRSRHFRVKDEPQIRLYNSIISRV